MHFQSSSLEPYLCTFFTPPRGFNQTGQQQIIKYFMTIKSQRQTLKNYVS